LKYKYFVHESRHVSVFLTDLLWFQYRY
jgi:hypothetical protein